MGQVIVRNLDDAVTTLTGGAPKRMGSLLAPLSPLLPRAAAIALELDHPIQDCFYLALSEIRTAPLVTDDRRLVTRLQPTTFQVRALRSWRPN